MPYATMQKLCTEARWNQNHTMFCGLAWCLCLTHYIHVFVLCMQNLVWSICVPFIFESINNKSLCQGLGVLGSTQRMWQVELGFIPTPTIMLLYTQWHLNRSQTVSVFCINVFQLTSAVHCEALFSSTNDIFVSFARNGGVTDLPGEAVGVAKGVVRRLDLKIDWGVKAGNPHEEAAVNALAL